MSTFSINKIYDEDALLTMAKMPDDFVDLTITSPPYDHLRHYEKKIQLNTKSDVAYSFNFQKIARELFRITKDGGVVVWVVVFRTL